MDMLDHDRLAVPPPEPIEGLEQVVLELDQFVGVAAVDRDVLLPQMTLSGPAEEPADFGSCLKTVQKHISVGHSVHQGQAFEPQLPFLRVALIKAMYKMFRM
jgi:hypothetical protein